MTSRMDGTIAPRGAASPAQVPVIVRPHPRGMRGVRLGADEVASRIARDARCRPVIEWSRRVVQQAKLPAPRGYPQPDQIVGALFAAWKRDVAFVKDPVNTELMMGTTQLLCLDPNGYCIPAGDCDDQIIGLGAAIASCGIPVWVRVRRYQGQSQAHITLLYDSAARLGGPVKCLDPSTDSGVCSDAPYLEQFVIEVNMGQNDDAGGQFIGIGAPPTTPTTVPTTLPDDQTQAWLLQITNTKAELDASASRLRNRAAAFTKVRADLGLPQNDPSLGEGAVSPLAQYATGHAWTPEAQAAESKLLQTATFMSSVLGDGLAGKRPMYFFLNGALGGLPQNDIGFGALPGDTFGLLMLPDANGNIVPTYVDPVTEQPTGTIGLAPIILGLAIVAGIVLTVGTTLAVIKIMDYMAAAHHDDMLNKVADQQAQLVQSGQQTPAQASQFMHAMSDFAAATAPPPPESIVSKLATPAVAAVLGILAGFLVARFVPRGGS